MNEIWTEPPEAREQLDQLHCLLNFSPQSQETLQIYITALDELRKSYSVAFRPEVGLDSGDVIWLFRVFDEYLTLL